MCIGYFADYRLNMNSVCYNCQQAPAYGPNGLCSACAAQYSALPPIPDVVDPSQPWACPYCSAANQPGQPTCWQCQKVNLGLVQSPKQSSFPHPAPPQNVAYWQCTCGYAFNTGPKCNNCRQPKPVTTWKCDTCGYEYNLYEVCEKCKNQKGKATHPPPAPTQKEPLGPWTCPKCSYEYNLDPTCLKCKTAKPTPRKPQKQGCCIVC